MFKVLAQEITVGTGANPQTIKGPLVGIENVGDLMNVVLQQLLFPAAGIVLLFVAILGGYDLMLSRGDPAKIKSAKAKLTAGVIGIVLLTVSYLGVRLISQMFNLGTDLF